MTIRLSPADERLGCEGLADLVESDGWWTPLRLPSARQALLHPDLALRSTMPAGARFSFRTDAHRIELIAAVERVASSGLPPAPFDLLVDGVLVARQTVEGVGRVTFDDLGDGEKDIEIWLPHYGYPRLGTVELVGATTVRAGIDSRPRWIVYGSSITQCREAPGPSDTWPALVARQNGWNLRCLGFGGQCQLDPAVARYIRNTPAERIQLCLGVNVHGAASFTSRTLGPAVIGFIEAVRDGHRDTPLTVMTPIASPDRESERNAAGLTLAEVRIIVAESAGLLAARGDGLRVIDGLSVLGIDEASLLVDGLHPSGRGYRIMADRLAPILGTGGDRVRD